ncbi:transcriptional regulator [Vreelandella hamiltonii]|uniref:Transcriptional regulator n=3 Tax=Halomonadaceae TaxID=28256 RepID=A0A8H9I383_9GAMM|nr:PLP-dependent aminotransferase family protein [Halomonas hamiltonii]GGW26472.1 transcriptional regulator [Halomonas hamiltonii]
MKQSASDSDWIIDALALRMHQHATRSLSQRLYHPLKEWVRQGKLTAGQRLPSSRRMSDALGVSRNTVLAATDRLLAEGLLVARQGAGLYVAQLPRVLDTETAPPPKAVHYSSRGRTLLALSKTLSNGYRAFSPGVPALDLFPEAQWQRLVRQHQRNADVAWMDYQTGGGLAALKVAISDYLRLSRAVRCQPEQVIITQGAQQAFELITQLLTDPDDAVWMEEPGYGGAKACFLAAGLDVTPVPVDADGLDPALGEKSAPAPRLIYTTPSHQYPTGVTMPVTRRLALLDVAERCGGWIIEDDYDSEFRYDTPPLPSLQGLTEQAPVIYVGTFSKVLYPGLRLGYLVAPPELAPDVCRAQARLHREGHYPLQSALAAFMASGHFTRHITRMRTAYRHRQSCLRAALAPAVAAGLRLSEGHAGMHLLAELSSIEEETALVSHAAQAGITLSPLSHYYLSANKRFGLVLGYASANEQTLAWAGQWLSNAYLAHQTRTPDTPLSRDGHKTNVF